MQNFTAPVSFVVLPTTLSIKDLKKICRICLSQEKLFPIRRTFVSDLKVSSLLEFSVMIDLTNRKLPQNICETCLGNLYNVYEFKKKSQDSESILKIYLEVAELRKENDNDVAVNEEFKIDNTSIYENCISNNVLDEDSKSITLVEEKLDYKIEPDVCIKPQKQNRITKKPEIKCYDCEYIAKNRVEIRKHCKETLHSNKYRTKCETCNKMILRQNLAFHAKTHGRVYECDICGQKFTAKHNVRRHKLSHTGERPHVCKTCGKDFTRSEYLRNHMKSHQSDYTPDPTTSRQKKKKLQLGEIKFTCNYCGRGFRNAHFFNAHLKRHASDDESNKSDKSRDFVCEICGRAYTTRAILNHHKLSHAKSFLCSVCGKIFATNTTLKIHSAVHTGEKPYSCNVCKKTFPHTTNLHTHMLTHSEHKPYSCNSCCMSFKQPQHLRRHMRTHTGERPFSCQYCKKSFALKENMVVHIRIHTGETPFACNVCGKGFYDSSSMKKHRRGHKEWIDKDAGHGEELQNGPKDQTA